MSWVLFLLFLRLRKEKDNVTLGLDLTQFKLIDFRRSLGRVIASPEQLYMCDRYGDLKAYSLPEKYVESEGVLTGHLMKRWVAKLPFLQKEIVIDDRWDVLIKKGMDFSQFEVVHSKNGKCFFSFQVSKRHACFIKGNLLFIVSDVGGTDIRICHIATKQMLQWSIDLRPFFSDHNYYNSINDAIVTPTEILFLSINSALSTTGEKPFYQFLRVPFNNSDRAKLVPIPTSFSIATHLPAPIPQNVPPVPPPPLPAQPPMANY